MKKIKLLGLVLVVFMLFTACGESSDEKGEAALMNGNGSGSSNADKDGNSNQNGNGDGAGESVENGDMVWFPKSAKATLEDGTLAASIETELTDSKLVYKYYMYSSTRERYYGFEIGYDDDKVTEYFDLDGDKWGNTVSDDKEEKIIEYIEEENAIYVKDIIPDTGNVQSSDKYTFKFDDEGKVIERVEDSVWYSYDENGEKTNEDVYQDVYKFEYADDGYNIIWNSKPFERTLYNGETAKCIKRTTTFIPYDTTKNHTKTIEYYLEDGTLAIIAKDSFYDILEDNSPKTEYVYNSEGYMIEQYAYLADGTKKQIEPQWECEFNDAGNVKKYTGYSENGELESKGEFTYDSNGNISNLVLEIEGEKYNVEIEWMLVPKCLDDVNQLIYGNDLYAISELVEDVIPETDIIDLLDTYYTKDMLKGLLN